MEVGSWELLVVGWSCLANTSTSLSVTVDEGLIAITGRWLSEIKNERIKNLKCAEVGGWEVGSWEAGKLEVGGCWLLVI